MGAIPSTCCYLKQEKFQSSLTFYTTLFPSSSPGCFSLAPPKPGKSALGKRLPRSQCLSSSLPPAPSAQHFQHVLESGFFFTVVYRPLIYFSKRFLQLVFVVNPRVYKMIYNKDKRCSKSNSRFPGGKLSREKNRQLNGV